MEALKKILGALVVRLEALAKGNAVVGKKISVGDRHVIPLCELSLGLAGGGGSGQGGPRGKEESKGQGGGAGGGARVTPLAVIVVEGGKVRIEHLGRDAAGR
jgi:uncharacterized spore protein YtfJ